VWAALLWAGLVARHFGEARPLPALALAAGLFYAARAVRAVSALAVMTGRGRR
jgi:hypothetical protein